MGPLGGILGSECFLLFIYFWDILLQNYHWDNILIQFTSLFLLLQKKKYFQVNTWWKLKGHANENEFDWLQKEKKKLQGKSHKAANYKVNALQTFL